MMGRWSADKLCNLGITQTGSTPKTTVKENFGSAIPFVKPADFQSNGLIDYNNDGLSEKGLAESRLVKKDSVLMVCIGATIGKVGYTSVNVTTNQQINSFTPNEGMITKYCYYAMLNNEFHRQVIYNSSQATLPIINKSKWSNLEIKYPEEIEEQQHIVTILDQAFADIEKVRANAEQNLKNACELFDSYLQQVFSQRGEEWSILALGSICDLVGGGTPSKANADFYVGPIPWATVRDMRSEMLSKTELAISPEAVSQSSTNIIASDNIIIATRVGLGKVCIIQQDTAINQDLKAVIPKDDSLNRQFLFYWLKSVAHLIKGAGTGATVQGVRLPFVKALEIPTPPPVNQLDIVSTLEELNRSCSVLETIYVTKLNSLDELKKSLLQKAFSGELTKSKGIAA